MYLDHLLTPRATLRVYRALQPENRSFTPDSWMFCLEPSNPPSSSSSELAADSRSSRALILSGLSLSTQETGLWRMQL